MPGIPSDMMRYLATSSVARWLPSSILNPGPSHQLHDFRGVQTRNHDALVMDAACDRFARLLDRFSRTLLS